MYSNETASTFTKVLHSFIGVERDHVAQGLAAVFSSRMSFPRSIDSLLEIGRLLCHGRILPELLARVVLY